MAILIEDSSRQEEVWVESINQPSSLPAQSQQMEAQMEIKKKSINYFHKRISFPLLHFNKIPSSFCLALENVPSSRNLYICQPVLPLHFSSIFLSQPAYQDKCQFIFTRSSTFTSHFVAIQRHGETLFRRTLESGSYPGTASLANIRV